MYPVALGTYVSLTAHCADPALEGGAPAREAPWSADVPGAGLAREFAQFERWEPEVRALMEVRSRVIRVRARVCVWVRFSLMETAWAGAQAALRVPQVNGWAVHTSPALPSLVCGNVVLLGDAVRTLLPSLSARRLNTLNGPLSPFPNPLSRLPPHIT